MLVFAVVALWLTNRAFPSNWLLLLVLGAASIPIAILYGWLTDRDAPGIFPSPPFRLPKLLLIAVGVAALVGLYLSGKETLDAALYMTN
jgi:hypothetical protein